MRFVIATLPDVHFNLGRDLRLVKACALYGDESVLFSPNYSFTSSFLDFSSRPLLHRLIYLALWKSDPGFVVGEKLTRKEREARIKDAKEKSQALFSKAETVSKLQSEIANSDKAKKELEKIDFEIRPLCKVIESIFSDEKDSVQRAREIAKADELGLVKIENIDDEPSLYFSQEKLKADVGAELSRADSYGALDERFLPRLGSISPNVTQKLRATYVAAQMFDRLPGFSEATFGEIRDVRHELAPYLARFRKAIIDISNKIQSAPWDQDFPHEVERELQLRLHPAVSEIEEQIQANSYLKEIVHRAVKNPLLVPASSAFGLLLSSAAHTPALISQVASTLAGTSLLAFEAHKEWKANRRKAEGNEFFFYYRASVSLKKGRRRWSAP